MKGKLYVYIHRQNERVIIHDENKTAVFTKTFYEILSQISLGKMWVYVCTLGPCVMPLTKIIAYIQTGAERIGTGSVLKSSFTICKKIFFLVHL